VSDVFDGVRDHHRAVMGPGFVQLAANLGRNLKGRLGILTAVFEAASSRRVGGWSNAR
jgi:hypothetical protein